MKVELFYQTRNGGWESAGIVDPVRGAKFKNADISLRFTCFPSGEETGYELEFSARYPTRVKIAGSLDGGEAWHLIPCCIHGDNNLANAKPGQYPNLTREYPEAIYSSPVWEFRAAGAFTGESRYRDAARKAALFYHKPVRELNVCGTPMDTWKAPRSGGESRLYETRPDAP